MRGKLRAIEKRANTVRSTKKIANVMKMVSASKFKSFHKILDISERYYNDILSVAGEILSCTAEEEINVGFFEKRDIKSILLICIASDKNLCGNFNYSICLEVDAFIKLNVGKNIQIIAIGFTINKFLKKHWPNINCLEISHLIKEEFGYNYLFYLAKSIINKFISKEHDAVYIVFSEFINSIKRQVSKEIVLPLNYNEICNDFVKIWKKNKQFVIEGYEPNKLIMIDDVLIKLIIGKLYNRFLNNVVSEHCARMFAMDNAVKNATEISEQLTLMHNRMRQSGVTTELLEVINGADAVSS